MREILFRGKRVDNGEWVYGNLILGTDSAFHEMTVIENTNPYEFRQWDVNRSTVGQFTGLTDKNGTKIFEGDINQDGSVLLWCEELALFCFHRYNNEKWIRTIYPISTNDKIVITGNIHDNPKT